jgi:glycine cleavage system transcriptional repressor
MATPQAQQQVMQITCIGEQHDDITKDIVQIIEKYETQLETLRQVNEYGRSTSAFTMVGDWNHINKIEGALNKLVDTYPNHSITSTLSPYEDEENDASTLLYHVNIMATSGVSIIPDLIEFLRANDIALLQLTVDNYPRQGKQAGTMVVNAKVAIDMQFALSEIREQFIVLCDSLNVDGIIDPVRPY